MILAPLFSAVKNFFKKPVTIRYPESQRVITERERGIHWLVTDKCTGCSMCFQVCPSRAIEMVKVEQRTRLSKFNKRKIRPEIDYSRCIFCGMCVDVCIFGALHMSHNIIVLGREPEDFRGKLILTSSEEFPLLLKRDKQIVSKTVKLR